MTNSRRTRAVVGVMLGAALLVAACGGEPVEPVADSVAEPTRDLVPDVTPDPEKTEAQKEEQEDEEEGSSRRAGIPDRGQPVTVRRIVDGDTVEVAATASGGVLSTTAEIERPLPAVPVERRRCS